MDGSGSPIGLQVRCWPGLQSSKEVGETASKLIPVVVGWEIQLLATWISPLGLLIQHDSWLPPE